MNKRLSLSHFPPGQDILVEKCGNAGGTGAKKLCRIVGAADPGYLFIHNTADCRQPFLRECDKQCIVRYLHDGAAVGFRAAILSLAAEPFSFAVLSYPSGCEEVLVRRAERVQCNIPAKLVFLPAEEGGARGEERAVADGGKTAGGASVESSGLSLRGRIADVSEGGCQILVPVLDPANPEYEPPAFAGDIPASVHTDYLRERLAAYILAGEKFRMEFDLPFDPPASFSDIGGEIRWVKAQATFYAAGIRFETPPANLEERLRKLIEVQRKYFAPPLLCA